MKTEDEVMEKVARAVAKCQQVPEEDWENTCRQSDEYIIRTMKTREDALCKEVASLTKKNLELKSQKRALQEALANKINQIAELKRWVKRGI